MAKFALVFFLLLILAQTEASEKKVGFILGVWDFFHEGHEILIQNVVKRCDELVIGVHRSEFVETYKNKRPFMTTENRETLLLTYANFINIPVTVIIVDYHEEAYSKYPITTVFHGDDWEESKYRKWIGEDILQKYNISYVIHLILLIIIHFYF